MEWLSVVIASHGWWEWYKHFVWTCIIYPDLLTDQSAFAVSQRCSNMFQWWGALIRYPLVDKLNLVVLKIALLLHKWWMFHFQVILPECISLFLLLIPDWLTQLLETEDVLKQLACWTSSTDEMSGLPSSIIVVGHGGLWMFLNSSKTACWVKALHRVHLEFALHAPDLAEL